MSLYLPYYPTWEDEPDTDTPITAAALNHMDAGIIAASQGGVDYKGTWAAGTAYKKGDVVLHDGVEYVAVNPSTGQEPPPTLVQGPAEPGGRLGVQAKPITDWNAALENGWYYANMGTSGPPELSTGWAHGIVSAVSPEWIVQEVWDFVEGPGSQHYERRRLNDVWSGWVAVRTGYGTAFPTASLPDGYEFTLVDSLSAPTYQWRFRYVKAKASNKWVFVGGPPLASYVEGGGSLGNGGYTDIAGGPSLTVPVAGDYLIRMGAWIYHGQTCESWMSFSINGAAPVDGDGFHHNAAAGTEFYDSYERRRTFAAGTALLMKYRTNWSASWYYRFLSVLPVAVGG